MDILLQLFQTSKNMIYKKCIKSAILISLVILSIYLMHSIMMNKMKLINIHHSTTDITQKYDLSNSNVIRNSDSILGTLHATGDSMGKEVACGGPLEHLKSLEDGESLFANIDLEDECHSSLNGDPFHTLENYKNPCWISTLEESDPYQNSFCKVPYTYGIYKELIKTFHKEHRSSRMRCLPYAFIAGFTKSGTTDLYAAITRHPLIIKNVIKEYHYWNEYRFGPGWLTGCHRRNLDTKFMPFQEYIDRFDAVAHQINKTTIVDVNNRMYHPHITVDASPSYIWRWYHWKLFPANQGLSEPKYILAHTLKYLLPQVKVILIMRNPIDRAYSDFKRMYSGSPVEFHNQIVKEVNNVENTCHSLRACLYNKSAIDEHYSVLRPSLYYTYINDWFKVIPRSQFLFLKSEEYYEDRTAVLPQVFKFLGLEDLTSKQYQGIKDMSVMNPTKRGHTDMLPATRDFLQKFFSKHNSMLSNLIQDNKFLWNDS